MPNHKAVDLFGERPARRIPAKPFIKWAGGKGNLLQKLEALLPTNFDDLENLTYIEPFVGGGAMLFHVLQRHRCIKRAVINDINPDLIRCYQLIANDPQTLIERLKNIENNYYSVDFPARKELFYAYREQYNSEGIHPDERAALFIFLNHTCFNGLYRVNSKGLYNVPYGKYKRPFSPYADSIRELSYYFKTNNIVFLNGHYSKILNYLDSKSFVYLDPPYDRVSTTSFISYSSDSFSRLEQIGLKNFCDKLTAKGIRFMQSNSATDFIKDLYKDYKVTIVGAKRSVNSDGNQLEDR